LPNRPSVSDPFINAFSPSTGCPTAPTAHGTVILATLLAIALVQQPRSPVCQLTCTMQQLWVGNMCTPTSNNPDGCGVGVATNPIPFCSVNHY
jgi:hypothetical protein